MGLFTNKTRKVIGELRKRSQYYSTDLNKEISEKLEEVQSEYHESDSTFADFAEYARDLKNRVSEDDAKKLDVFLQKINALDRSARKGVDALWELSRNQRKLMAENLREFEALEN